MKQERKRFGTWNYKRKADGSSIYFYIPIALLLLLVLFFANVYLRAADTLYENYQTSIDTANLAITVANNDVLLHGGRLGIVAYSDDNSTTGMNANERIRVAQLFETYERTLQSNVGLDDTFAFNGGTCGWAGDMIASGNASIDSFLIYEVAPTDTVYAYEIGPIESYQTASEIQTKIKKRVVGSVTRDADGDIINSTAYTPENTLITDDTVYSKVSFPVKASSIANLNDGKTDGNNTDSQDYIDGKMRVSASSTTSLKTSTAFEDLNGNGWFQ